jgi:hypothetical protein
VLASSLTPMARGLVDFGCRSVDENSNFREIEIANNMIEAVSTPDVTYHGSEGPDLKHRNSKEERGHEFHQKDSKARRRAVLSECRDRLLRIIYVPSRLIVSGNAAATAQNILASERLFRLGIASEVICAVEYVYLLWVLYRLLSGVSKTHASLMVIFGVAFVPIMCMNAVSGIAALALLRGVDFPPVFNQPQRESLALLFLGVGRYGYDVGWIFGLSLFHFGVCVWKSGFLPRFLGALLIAACFGYLAVSLTPFLLPSYANIVSRLANIPLTLGEPAAILWLLIRGAKNQPLQAGAIE